MTELETLEIETAPMPDATVVVMHGLGADGSDFLPIAGELGLPDSARLRFVFPHAPHRAVTINGGWRMRAWYDILGTEAIGRQDEAGLRESMAAIEQLLARERARGIASTRTVLAGFSQGCAMALMTGVRHAQPLAGIAGLSGYLPLAAQTAAERSAANAATPIFMAHGRADEVVVVQRGRAARDALLALGSPVEWHEYAMGHSVCEEEIRDLGRWLREVLVL